MKPKLICIRCLFNLLLLTLFYSCQSHYTENSLILKAESLINSNPDSAYLLLSSINHPDQLSEVDYPAWCLHFSYSQIKLHKKISSDSLLQLAVKYYEKQNLPKYSGTSYYLLGCYYSLLKKDQKALAYFKKAEIMLEQTNENNLKGLVSFHIGILFSQDELYNHSLSYFNKSVNYFSSIQNLKYEAYAYREISNMYYQLHKPLDSIMYYSNKALDLALQSKDTINYYFILVRQGELLCDSNELLSKNKILKGYPYFPENKPFNAAYLAYVYSKLNRIDSAFYYLQISQKDTVNTPYKLMGVYAASLIAKNRNDYKNAYLYLERLYSFRDSIFQENMRSQLYRIDKQYNTAEKERKISTLKISSQRQIILIALLIIAILAVLTLFLLFKNKQKRKDILNMLEKQNLQYETEFVKMRNVEKKKILYAEMLANVTNTLKFNELKRDFRENEMHNEFYIQLVKQSILQPESWQFYIDQVNIIFDNRIIELTLKFRELTQIDLIVISLICLERSNIDCIKLLNMNKDTFYKRRKTIKKRLNLDSNQDLDSWIHHIIKGNP